MKRVSQGSVSYIDPNEIERNPENPRLIFREDELLALQESIESQGILVPLTLYERGDEFVLIDGERRWRCALKLGLTTVPVIIQPEPDPVTNIMMMFAIHKTRNDWDPLPTAMKLQDLESALAERLDRQPTEQELAAAASLSRGEVRRYRNIMNLPPRYKKRLMKELEKPRSEQALTVDHVLESMRGAEALAKQGLLEPRESRDLANALVQKFEAKRLTSTVEPRLLTRIARAVQRGEIGRNVGRRVALKLTADPGYTVKRAFGDSVERVDYEHGTEQLAARVTSRLEEHMTRGYELGDSLEGSLTELASVIRKVLKNARS